VKTPDTHRHDHYSLSEHPWGVTPRILDTKCYCAAVALIPNIRVTGMGTSPPRPPAPVAARAARREGAAEGSAEEGAVVGAEGA